MANCIPCVRGFCIHMIFFLGWLTFCHSKGDFFIPAFQCPHRVERIGTLGDGGKWVCGLDRVAKQDKCVIYSFGQSRSPSFFSVLVAHTAFPDRHQRRVIV
jgi:Methyltransferase domain